jgi:hypothetical protein
MELVAEQRPLIYADEHYGSPENSSIRYESDFALEKRLTDVVVVGKAVAPGRQRSPEVMVRLEVQGRAKDLRVMGERRWLRILGTVAPCDPVPFAEMPLTFDRAFGGEDASNGPQKVAVERRNPSGVGFYPLKPTKEAEGLALANLEPPKQRIASFRDKVDPVGFGFIGRHWKPRVGYAGTYDQRWRDETSPFLPSDFDPRYFQGAPEDQQFPLFRGGEVIRCVHMAAAPVVTYRIPSLPVPVRFCFEGNEVTRQGVLDTVVLEPHLCLAMLSWRASVPLGKKLHALRSIEVGNRSDSPESIRAPLVYRRGKPFFRGIDATIRWLQKRRGGPR